MNYLVLIAPRLLLTCVVLAVNSNADTKELEVSTSQDLDTGTMTNPTPEDALTAGRSQSWKEKEMIEAEIMDKVGEDKIIYLIDIHMFTSKPPNADYRAANAPEEDPEPLEEAAAYVMFTQWFKILRERRSPEPPMSALKEEFDKIYEEVLLNPCRTVAEIYESHQDYYVTSREMKMDGSEFTPVGALRPISEYCKQLAEEEMKEKVFAIVDRDVRDGLN